MNLDPLGDVTHTKSLLVITKGILLRYFTLQIERTAVQEKPRRRICSPYYYLF